IDHGIQGELNIVPGMLLNGRDLFRVDVLQLYAICFGKTDASFPEEYGTAVVFPDVFSKGTDLSVGTDGDQTDHFSFGQVRKRDVLIGNNGRIVQIGIDQVLDLAVIKEIDPDDVIVRILHPNYDEGIVLGVAVGQGADML